MLKGSENCDDGTNDGLGCKTACKTGADPKWICTGGNSTNATTCVAKCGDGFKVDNETCDDGSNDTIGCNSTCTGSLLGYNCGTE